MRNLPTLGKFLGSVSLANDESGTPVPLLFRPLHVELKGLVIIMGEYWRDLRELVGHMPILVCGASVIVENSKGEILLQLRKDNNCWAYPGGLVDVNEVVEEAAKRELTEETGIVAHSLQLFGVFSGKELYHIYPNGDEVSIVDVVYVCKNFSGNIKADNIECADAKFFPIDKLPENMSPPVVSAISKYLDSRAI